MEINATFNCLKCKKPFGFKAEVSMDNNAVNVKCPKCSYVNEFKFYQDGRVNNG